MPTRGIYSDVTLPYLTLIAGLFLPPLFFDGVQLPYSDTFKYLGMVCDIYR
jgi:hypothetical protein